MNFDLDTASRWTQLYFHIDHIVEGNMHTRISMKAHQDTLRDSPLCSGQICVLLRAAPRHLLLRAAPCRGCIHEARHASAPGLQQGSGRGRGGQDHLTRAQRQRARHWALPTSGAHYTCVVGALVCCSHSPLQQKPGKPDLCCSLPPSPPSSPYLHHPASAPGS